MFKVEMQISQNLTPSHLLEAIHRTCFLYICILVLERTLFEEYSSAFPFFELDFEMLRYPSSVISASLSEDGFLQICVPSFQVCSLQKNFHFTFLKNDMLRPAWLLEYLVG